MKILGKFLKILGKIVLTLTTFLIVCILFYFGKLKFEELQAHREIKAVQTEMKPPLRRVYTGEYFHPFYRGGRPWL